MDPEATAASTPTIGASAPSSTPLRTPSPPSPEAQQPAKLPPSDPLPLTLPHFSNFSSEPSDTSCSSTSPQRPPTLPWLRRDGLSGWLADTLSTPCMVPALVVQALSTGILDATTYADFSTFASNQTGNTILLTVSVIGTIRVLLLLTGVSLAAFLGGAFVFGHIGHLVGVRRRAWCLFNTAYQCVSLAVAAVLLSPIGPHSTRIGGKHEWAPLFLFAQMSGAQVVMARQSGSQELPTAPMTSSFVDLVADKHLFVGPYHPKAGPRNRRLAYVLTMVIGGFIGSVLHKWAGTWVVILVTIGIKLVAFALLATCGVELRPKPDISCI